MSLIWEKFEIKIPSKIIKGFKSIINIFIKINHFYIFIMIKKVQTYLNIF